ncbi:uncharacterized protein TNCV_29491 [Trichonephila clavipes]|nr:uncharacterized protein TNCV_29491 [Trichonephila clavipes]
MIGLWPCSGSQVMLGSPVIREPTKPSREKEVLLTLSRAESIVTTCIDKCNDTTQNTKSHGGPWDTLATVGAIPRHLEKAEVVSRFCLTIGHEFLEVYLHFHGLAADEVCR